MSVAMARDTGPSPNECAKMTIECACYNLRRASRAVSQLVDGYFEEVGLKSTQFTLLVAVANAAESPPTMSALAEKLVLDPSSLSRNLAVLERLGFIRVLPRREDRRERVVSLMRAGRAAIARGASPWKQAQAALASVVGERELVDQLEALQALARSAQELRTRRARGQGPSEAPAGSNKTS
jgi:DNA-binding MarR family transcriptional regulator